MEKRLLEIFLEVIAIDAVSASERRIADYIIAFLRKLNLNPYEDKSSLISGGNCGNVICPVGNGGSYVILSHMDTARPTKDVKPQFLTDRITSDKTTVLGVDNRAGIACLLYAVEKLVLESVPLNDFTLAFTVQEETTLNGSLNLELGEKVKMGFVFDSHSRPGCFIVESAGSIGFTVTVFGKAAHSGLAPEKGIDAIKIASDAISRIDLGKIDEETTANIGIIRGGTATNVVPEETFVEGEVRSMILHKIDSKIDQIRHEFEKAAKTYGGRVEFTSFWNFKPFRVPQDSETYRRIEKVLLNTGLTPEPIISKGGSDANSLNAKGISCVNLGIGAENPHSNDEFILYEDLCKTAEIALELMKR